MIAAKLGMPHFDPISSAPTQVSSHEIAALAACIDACQRAEQACVSCADACLVDTDNDAAVANLMPCVRLDLDCADICGTTARLLARLLPANPQLLRQQLALCARACQLAAHEAERHHSIFDHFHVCANRCHACAAACRVAMAALAHSSAATVETEHRFQH